ncbi:MFS transporter, partial [Enterococcus faecalis]
MLFNLKLTEKGAIYVTSQQPVEIHGKPYNRSLLVGVFLIGTFCTILNQTLLTTALPTIKKKFYISSSLV